jgi:putative addiction module component (TIGR02574 family)
MGKMTVMKPSTVAKQALDLPAKERAKLAERLLESLDNLTEAEAEKLWVAEADRRAREIKEGKVKTVSAQELERRVQARLK